MRQMVEKLRSNLRIVEVTNDDLKKITRSNHQGIVICAEAMNLEKKIPKLNINRVLVLDHLQDVQNIGSIMRSMIALNFQCLIINQKGSPDLEQCGIKSASGAMEKIKIIQVPNIRYAISELKRQDFTCIALDHAGKNLDIKFEKIALVVGSEEEGISNIVKAECDHLIKLNTNLDFPILNVAVAAAIAMYVASN
jgi:23S rRNA (guanosine2251-2'-O)-methyltransferase